MPHPITHAPCAAEPTHIRSVRTPPAEPELIAPSRRHPTTTSRSRSHTVIAGPEKRPRILPSFETPPIILAENPLKSCKRPRRPLPLALCRRSVTPETDLFEIHHDAPPLRNRAQP